MSIDFSERFIDGERRTLLPLAEMRATYGLGANFSTAAFLDQRPEERLLWGNEEVRERLASKLAAAVPPRPTLKNLPEVPDGAAAVLRSALVDLSRQYDLTIEEIDGAVLDLRDLLMPAVYRLVDLYYAHPGRPAEILDRFDMDELLQKFLNETTFVGEREYDWAPAGWRVQVIYDHFGPCGLRVDAGQGEIYYVHDPTLAAPPAETLLALARTLGRQLAERFAQQRLDQS